MIALGILAAYFVGIVLHLPLIYGKHRKDSDVDFVVWFGSLFWPIYWGILGVIALGPLPEQMYKKLESRKAQKALPQARVVKE